jgi:hypothetical protein
MSALPFAALLIRSGPLSDIRNPDSLLSRHQVSCKKQERACSLHIFDNLLFTEDF